MAKEVQVESATYLYACIGEKCPIVEAKTQIRSTHRPFGKHMKISSRICQNLDLEVSGVFESFDLTEQPALSMISTVRLFDGEVFYADCQTGNTDKSLPQCGRLTVGQIAIRGKDYLIQKYLLIDGETTPIPNNPPQV